MPNFSQDFVKAVQIELDKKWVSDFHLGKNFLAALFKQGETKVKGYTKDMLGKIRYEQLGGHDRLDDRITGITTQDELGDDPLKGQTGATASDTRDKDDSTITRRTPAYTFPSFRRVLSHFLTGDVCVPLARTVGKVVGEKPSELAKKLYPALQEGAEVLRMQFMYQGLFMPVIESPRIDQGGNRAFTMMPKDQQYISTIEADGGVHRANLKVEDLARLVTHTLNGVNKSWSPLSGQMGDSLKDVNCVILASNRGWIEFLASNYAKLSNEFFFGETVKFGSYGEFSTFMGQPVVLIPDDEGGGTGNTGRPDRVVGRGEYVQHLGINSNYMDFAFRSAIQRTAAADALGGMTRAKNYITSEESATANYYTNQGLYQIAVVHPKALDFQASTQYDIPSELYTNPDRSNEQFIYSSLGMNILKMNNKAVSRVWFSGPEGTALSKT